MIHAILHNKAGKSLTSNEIHWRQIFTGSEDSLTSTIFGNLLHLPVELFWQILNKACCIESATAHATPKILTVEFWPHWEADKSKNAHFIEPDIFIRTGEFDLIIEIKRYDDNNHQSREQWETEFQGYLNEYGPEQKEVILLAVGGLIRKQPEQIEFMGRDFKVLYCRWMRLLNEIKIVQSRLEKNKSYLNNIESTLTILNDIIRGFEIHGYAVGRWFEDEDFSKITPINTYHFATDLIFRQ